MSLARWRVAAAVFVLGTLVMLRAQMYFGGLLRGWDAQYYFAAAHSLVFDRDLDITRNLEATPFKEPFDRDGNGSLESASRVASGRIVSTYPLGLSLLEAPLLAAGHAARRLAALLGVTSERPPGYGDVEIWAVALGLLAITAAGFQLLDALLRPSVPSPWRELALLAMWWGTSLLYYSAIFPFMAHAAGFAVVVWTVHTAESIRTGNRPLRALWLVGVGLAALYLIRPQQVLLALPLLVLLRSVGRRPRREWMPWAAAAAALLVAAVALQIGVHAELAQDWAVNVDRPTQFHWLSPDLWTVLVSPTRGLLWMSPVVIIAALGFAITPLARLPATFAAFALHAVVQIYVVACWMAPHQGDAFGARMWVESAGAVACGLGLLFVRTSPRQRWLALAATLLCVLWTNRLLILYVSGRLPMGLSYGECLHRVLSRSS